MKAKHLVCAFILATAGPAAAHHSFAMFDQQKSTFVEGTVKEFEWANPHAFIYVTTRNGVEWAVEMGSLTEAARGGWRRDTIKPGERIKIEIHPLKDGAAGGQFLVATLQSGRVIGQVDGGNRNTPGAGGDEEALKATPAPLRR